MNLLAKYANFYHTLLSNFFTITKKLAAGGIVKYQVSVVGLKQGGIKIN